MSDVKKGHYEALVRIVCGDKMLNTMMKNAGLGISGVGVPKICRITYKDGESVDEARVQAALDNMARQAEQEGDMCIISSSVLGVAFVEDK